MKEIDIENAFLEKITQLVEADIAADWQLEKLCKALAMSRSQIYRKIKTSTGYSTTIFIRCIRLRRALQLLKTTDLPIAHIAYAVGFNDPAFFTNSFSQMYGKTPSEIRK